MSVSENLQILRKRSGITQEQLADELGVSRQAISKWETGEAFPETDKLIALCDKFGVSCDTLLRGSVEESDLPDPSGSAQEKKRIDRFSLMMAAGVGVILLGVAICVLLCGLGTFYGIELLQVFGTACILLAVAFSVFLFVYGGITNENYKKSHPERQGVLPQDSEKFMRRYPIAMAGLIAGIILLAVFLILGYALFVEEGTKQGDLTGCVLVAIFFAGMFVCAGGLCLLGIRREGYSVTDPAAEAEKRKKEGTLKRVSGTVGGVIMMTATVIFLLCGFLGELWHPAWIVFPVGGILCGIVSSILESIDKKK